MKQLSKKPSIAYLLIYTALIALVVVVASRSYGGFGANIWTTLSFAMLFRLLTFTLGLTLIWRWIAVTLLGTTASVVDHITLVSHGQYKTSIQPLELVFVSALIFTFLFAVVEVVEYIVRLIHKNERDRIDG